jgi:hypothetical protein
MKKIIYILILSYITISWNNLYAQKNTPPDSSSLQGIFQYGKWDIHHRTMFMATINQATLKDDYAVGTGIGASFLTRPYYGLQLGVGAFSSFNVLSSDLTTPDAQTQQPNRYELGLFDVENPKNKADLHKLELLYLRYNFRKSFVEVGRIALNTPFVNPQDGRMRGTAQQGIYLSIKEFKKLHIDIGWLTHISPRSTVRWVSMGESLGMYPLGVDTQGKKSAYTGRIQSEGLGLLHLHYQATPQLQFHFWNGYFENVMNTAFLEVQHDKKMADKSVFYQKAMLLRQDAVNNGGNNNSVYSYIDKNSHTYLFSTQIGWKTPQWDWNMNYTRITADGRYLMPREWGKDYFYTFLPRERNEGVGDVHALMTKISRNHQNWRTSLAYGYYQLPDARNYVLNKYAMPSYHQINYDFAYQFQNFWKGLVIRGLVVYKIAAGETYDNPRLIYNKVDMWNLNLVIDFKL